MEESLGALVEGVPFNTWLGVRAGEIGPTFAEMTLSIRPEHLNHVGTVQGAAQYALAESTSGLLLFAAFSDLSSDAILLTTAAQLAYRRPAVGNLRARASLPEGEAARVQRDMDSGLKTRVRVPVEVFDSRGQVVMTVEVEWLLRHIS